jgi:hypothetical protein
VLWYYRSVANILKQSDTNPLIDELDRVVSEIERTVRQWAGRETSDKQKAARK